MRMWFFLWAGVSAQTNKTVWASFALLVPGEASPKYGSYTPGLTTAGAEDLYRQGAAFRHRYLRRENDTQELNITANRPIHGISRESVDDTQLNILTSSEAPFLGGALAFLQGLYPSVVKVAGNGPSDILISGQDSDSAVPPMGYQCPSVQAVTSSDAKYRVVRPTQICPALPDQAHSREDYRQGERANAPYLRTFFSLDSFEGVVDASQVTYDHAYDLYALARYLEKHNDTFQESFRENASSWNTLEQIATQQQFLSYADSPDYLQALLALQREDRTEGTDRDGASDRVRELERQLETMGDSIVPGRTLLGHAFETFSTVMESKAAANKLTLVFGSRETMISLYALLHWRDQGPAFADRLPTSAAVAIFELISNTADTFPVNEKDLEIRTVFRDGAGADVPFVEQGLWEWGTGANRIRFHEFQRQLKRVSLSSADFCRRCRSTADFCAAELALARQTEQQQQQPGVKRALSPAVAGVIGAMTALGVLLVVGAVSFFLLGLRVVRPPARDQAEGTERDERKEVS